MSANEIVVFVTLLLKYISGSMSDVKIGVIELFLDHCMTRESRVGIKDLFFGEWKGSDLRPKSSSSNS